MKGRYWRYYGDRFNTYYAAYIEVIKWIYYIYSFIGNTATINKVDIGTIMLLPMKLYTISLVPYYDCP